MPRKTGIMLCLMGSGPGEGSGILMNLSIID